MFIENQDFTEKQEGNTSDDIKISKLFTANLTSSWSSRLKDPRIVRVSRAFGGKDRHSKVCTVRGLRDRRVRLSIPTAIQLYHLQDRLGLNQPSKVVEWLLKAAKQGIDELPPLQLPPGNFPQNLYPVPSVKDPKISTSINRDDRLEQSNSVGETRPDPDGKDENWTRNGEEKGNNLFTSSSFMNNSILYNSFHGLTPQAEEFQNFNVVYPSGIMQSYYNSAAEFDQPKHINSQILSSSSQNSMSRLTQSVEASNEPVRPFHFSMMTNKDNGFRST